MDIGFSEEQELLREAARKFLDAECTTRFVRERMAEAAACTDKFWAQIAEEDVGSGLGLVDLGVLMEEMGRAVMPGPYFATALLGGGAIAAAGSPAQRREYLPQIAAGALKATLALSEPSARWDAAGITLPARETRGGFALSGTKLFVADAHLADVIVVAARSRRRPARPPRAGPPRLRCPRALRLCRLSRPRGPVSACGLFPCLFIGVA